MNWYYWKKIGLDIEKFWRNIIRISIIPVVMVVAGIFVLKIIDIKNLWMLLILGVVYVILFAVGSWIFEMNDYEKSLIRGMISKVIKNTKER